MAGYDFNDANQQQFGALIPNGTLCKLMMVIRPGAAGPDGWLTASNDSDVLYLNCEFTVLDGPFARRKLWQNLTVTSGKVNDKGQSIGGEITRSTLRAVLESARNILPSDMSERAMMARKINGYQDLNRVVFAAKIGVEKGQNNYPDKNKVSTVITPDKKEYQQVMSGGSGCAPAQQAPSPAPSWAGEQGAPQPQAGQSPPWGSTPPPQSPKQPVNIPSWAQ